MAENAQKAKRKFNGFDVFLIVMVVAVLGAVFYLVLLPRLSSTSIGGNGDEVPIRYVLRCMEIPNEMQFEIHEGDSVVEIVKSSIIGHVVSSKIEPSTHVGKNSNGEYVTSESIDSKAVFLTVETTATKTDTGFDVGGDKPLRVNEGITVRTPDLCAYYVCISIEEMKD